MVRLLLACALVLSVSQNLLSCELGVAGKSMPCCASTTAPCPVSTDVPECCRLDAPATVPTAIVPETETRDEALVIVPVLTMVPAHAVPRSLPKPFLWRQPIAPPGALALLI